MMNEKPRNVVSGVNQQEVERLSKLATTGKEDHAFSCFFQMLTIMLGFLLFSLSVAVWVNWII